MRHIYRLTKIFAGIATILVFALAWPQGLAFSEPLSRENLPQVLEEVLSHHPDLILDVLRNNSESVLEIAQQGSNLRRKHNLEAQWAEDLKKEKTVKLQGRPVLGAPDAKVHIIAFTDFTCHYCQQASHTVDAILQEYGKKVCLVFKGLPLDEKGPGAVATSYFLAAAQQNEKLAWKLYKILFANSDKLVAEGEAYLKKTAEGLGLDMKKLQRDAHSKKIAEVVAEDLQDAQKLGIEGTPYFLVNRLVIRGALPLDLFKGAVDTALRHAK